MSVAMTPEDHARIDAVAVAVAVAIWTAIKEEREACAKIAESEDTEYRRVYDAYDLRDAIRAGIAAAIRART